MCSDENENWLTIWTRRPCGGGSGDLLVERCFQPAGRNTAVSFRIGADANFLDARFAQAAALDHRQRVGKGLRVIGVAANHQEAAHIGFAVQTAQ